MSTATLSHTALPPAGWWIHGAKDEELLQAFSLDADTHILRQSKRLHYEGNFLFLFCGSERAVLFDTGALSSTLAAPLVGTVQRLVAHRRKDAGDYEVVVAHTHAHNDHVAGDVLFVDQPGFRVVPASDLAAVQVEFSIARWPDSLGCMRLGAERELTVLPTPGHEPVHVMIYDPLHALLLTGDHLYRGRLYMRDQAAFTASVARALRFCESNPVRHLLGCHIEMSADGTEYPDETIYQPNEPPLQLNVEHLRKLHLILQGHSTSVITDRIHCGEFIIHPVLSSVGEESSK